MRERALHTADGSSVQARPTPADAGLPASPSPDSGLAPTRTVAERADTGPLTALRHQQFDDLPLQHAATTADGDRGPQVVSTLFNESGETWAYRVARGPAPFAGGRATAADGDAELRASPTGDPSLFTDGVLMPGESTRSTVSVSALSGAEPGWPAGEYTFLQPLTVWTEDRAFSYNWRVTLVV